jgi:large subunit ribosomal protein L29
MKASDLREKSDEDLEKELLDLSREAFNLRMQRGTGQLARSSQMGSVRRDIARIKTIQNERRKGQTR